MHLLYLEKYFLFQPFVCIITHTNYLMKFCIYFETLKLNRILIAVTQHLRDHIVVIYNCVHVAFQSILGFLFLLDCNMTCSFETTTNKKNSVLPFHLHIIQKGISQ